MSGHPSDGMHVLVRACGEVLEGADGAPILFDTVDQALSFARRFLCEPGATQRAFAVPRAA